MSWKSVIWLTCAGSVFATLVLVRVAIGGGDSDFFPAWLPVFCVSFYIFSFLYFLTVHLSMRDPFAKRGAGTIDYTTFKNVAFGCFTASFAVSYFAFGVPYFKALGICFLLCMLIPLSLYGPLVRWRMRVAGCEIIAPEKVAKIAGDHPDVLRFTEACESLEVFVTDTKRSNREARCLYLHRKSIPEMALSLDLCLEVSVDIRRKTPVLKSGVYQAYVHQSGEEGSRALVLSDDSRLPETWSVPVVDEAVVQNLRTCLDRFPHLEEAPLPIAVRDVEFHALGRLPRE